MTNERLAALSQAGVSIWLDDLSRERLSSGNLASLIAEKSVVGVTTNPSIFQAAISKGEGYQEQLAELARAGRSVTEIITEITTQDVRDACDLFAPLAASTEADGRVSIEVEPNLANDTAGTIAEAKELWDKVGRTNVFIKIPATPAGLPAITEVIAAGISVNVTLIFSDQRYREVVHAYIEGLEKAQAAGIDISTIRSVASFFVSRVDSEIDHRLEAIASHEALALRGKAAVANARIAFNSYLDLHETARWQALEAAGAHRQRPLWASTGTKNSAYSDTLYVAQLVTRNVVNTMPEGTLNAFADHGEVTGDTVVDHISESFDVFTKLSAAGVDLADVFQQLEDEGVSKFIDSWTDLVKTVEQRVEAVGA